MSTRHICLKYIWNKNIFVEIKILSVPSTNFLGPKIMHLKGLDYTDIMKKQEKKYHFSSYERALLNNGTTSVPENKWENSVELENVYYYFAIVEILRLLCVALSNFFKNNLYCFYCSVDE